MYRIGKLRFLTLTLSAPGTQLCTLSGSDIPVRNQRCSVLVQVPSNSKWYFGAIIIFGNDTQSPGAVRGYFGEAESGIGSGYLLYGNAFYTTL